MKAISKSNGGHTVEVKLKDETIGKLTIDGTDIKYTKEFTVK